MIVELDKIIGLEVYSTDFKGIGGKIKFDNSSFVVEEVIKDIEFVDDGYALYKLEKRGIDSIHALKEIEKHNLRLKIFGLKDANATTTQYAIATKKRYYKEVIGKNYSLKFLGYVNPLTKDILLGNRFTVIIKDANNNLDEFEDYIKEQRIANFYGYQRFGSSKPITHIIGKAIVKKRFKEAVELLIENSSMDFEYLVRLEYEKSKDPIRALRRIPLRVRRLFVEAYKSYIFNKTLSKILEEGYDLKAREGDITFINGELSMFNNKYSSILAIPTIGYGFKSKNRFANIIDEIMREEEITPKDFYIKEMQEVSSESNFRQAVLDCRDFSYRLDPLTISFMLQRGGYATILLRELMKPSDPITAGLA